jgi:hypothetical protein
MRPGEGGRSVSTMHSMTTSHRHSVFEPRISERSRGTAHPVPALTTRDRVARSLMLRPDAPGPGLVRR